MLGQPQVVIGTQVKHLTAAADPHVGPLRCGDLPFVLVQTACDDAIQLCTYMRTKFTIHCPTPSQPAITRGQYTIKPPS